MQYVDSVTTDFSSHFNPEICFRVTVQTFVIKRCDLAYLLPLPFGLECLNGLACCYHYYVLC